MKKVILISCFSLVVICLYSQSYSVKYRETLSYSMKIWYSSGSYNSYNSYYGNESLTANILQARLDANRKWLSEEYGKLKYAEFVNPYNKTLHRNWLRDYEDDIRNAGHYDLSNNRTAERFVYEYIGKFFNISTIKAEIELLKSLNSELYRIQYEDPNNYIYSRRYKAINETLRRLETCDARDISKLSWQETELNMDNNTYSNVNNNYSSYSSYGNNGSYNAPIQKNNPNVNKSYDNFTTINSVSVMSNQTVITLTFKYQIVSGQMWSSFWVDPKTYIVANGQKYYLTKAEGISTKKDETYIEWRSTKTYKLYFPAIPSSTSSIDLIEVSNSDVLGDWRFYGISLR